MNTPARVKAKQGIAHNLSIDNPATKRPNKSASEILGDELLLITGDLFGEIIVSDTPAKEGVLRRTALLGKAT